MTAPDSGLALAPADLHHQVSHLEVQLAGVSGELLKVRKDRDAAVLRCDRLRADRARLQDTRDKAIERCTDMDDLVRALRADIVKLLGRHLQ